ncbi:MAG TPA: hypothetical protein PK450_13475 [Paracoccaceae bacterium]|nr:hypothetical protein [Paracoccaceae bacterium]
MAFQFIGPVIASVLYVIVFQKAGFRGLILAVSAAPILGSVLSMVVVRTLVAGGGGPGMMILIPLIAIPLSLLPLLFLAFKSWPPAGAAPNTRSEN